MYLHSTHATPGPKLPLRIFALYNVAAQCLKNMAISKRSPSDPYQYDAYVQTRMGTLKRLPESVPRQDVNRLWLWLEQISPQNAT